MDKKGQMTIGTFMMVFITVIVGAILLQAIAQQVGPSSSTIVINDSIATVVNGTAQYFTDYKSITGVVVYNETLNAIVPAADYVITNNFIHPTTGALTVRIVPDTSTDLLTAWYVTGTAQRLDYISDSAGRSIASLIAIFFALAIAVVALTPTLRGGLLDLIGKN